MLLLATTLAACGADAPSPAAPRTHIDASMLARRSLSGSSLSQMQLLATPDGREVLGRVVACALPRGASITAITRDGTPYSFAGRIGLAPAWAQHAPSAPEQHRVSACVTVQTVGLTRA